MRLGAVPCIFKHVGTAAVPWQPLQQVLFTPLLVFAHCLWLDELSQNLELPLSAEAAACPTCIPSRAKAKLLANSGGSS